MNDYFEFISAPSRVQGCKLEELLMDGANLKLITMLTISCAMRAHTERMLFATS